MAFLAIDPGDTLGFAEFAGDGKFEGMGQVNTKRVSMQKWLRIKIEARRDASDDPFTLIICEDYKISSYSQKKFMAHKGSRVPTIKQIGSIESVAEFYGIPVHLQPNVNYPIGAKWGGFDIPSNHSISHQYVATAHGIFYLQQNGLRKPSLISVMKRDD